MSKDFLKLSKYSDTIINDMGSLVCGRKLGSGATRTVYRCALDDTKVIKVEALSYSFCNITEWEIWKEVRGTKYERYFAPCRDISPNGAVLVMDRTAPLHEHPLPKMLPSFFTDCHSKNFGWLNGRVVCHDYGYNDIILKGIRNSKLKRVKWR